MKLTIFGPGHLNIQLTERQLVRLLSTNVAQEISHNAAKKESLSKTWTIDDAEGPQQYQYTIIPGMHFVFLGMRAAVMDNNEQSLEMQFLYFCDTDLFFFFFLV